MIEPRVRSLGIMVRPAEGRVPSACERHCRLLSVEGAKLGIRVFVFSPDRIDWRTRRVTGFVYGGDGPGWSETEAELPRLVYDRCFLAGSRHAARCREAIRRLRNDRDIRFLGHVLGDKWEIYRRLAREPQLRPHLPPTKLLGRAEALRERLEGEGDLFLKPAAGSQGRGALRIRREADGRYSACGRNGRNEPIRAEFRDFSSLAAWLSRRTAGRKYIVQPYLALVSKEGDAFDIRSLVQKNARGFWRLTGMAVRKGRPGSLTSNLHGGGAALPTNPFLTEQFGEDEASAMILTLRRLSMDIPPVLESSYGRLVELGLDFGIDRRGRIWILEVNCKPGRAAFSVLSDPKQHERSVYSPLWYAHFLLANGG
jgi:hypothetical protein